MPLKAVTDRHQMQIENDEANDLRMIAEQIGDEWRQ